MLCELRKQILQISTRLLCVFVVWTRKQILQISTLRLCVFAVWTLDTDPNWLIDYELPNTGGNLPGHGLLTILRSSEDYLINYNRRIIHFRSVLNLARPKHDEYK